MSMNKRLMKQLFIWGALAIISLLVTIDGLTNAAQNPAIVTPAAFGQIGSRARVTTIFDRDWRFLKGDPSGAEKPGFDDSNWRKLDVPHDWSIDGPVDEKN